MKYCPKCRETKPYSAFKEKVSPRYESDRYFSYCNPCATTYKLKHRADNLADYQVYQASKNASYRQQKRRAAIEQYGGECMCCGENAYEFLAFDHINNDGAAHRKEVSSSAFLDWLKREGYPSNIQLLCHNCNMAKAYHGGCSTHRFSRAALIEKVEALDAELFAGKRGSMSYTRKYVRDLQSDAFRKTLTYLRGEDSQLPEEQ